MGIRDVLMEPFNPPVGPVGPTTVESAPVAPLAPVGPVAPIMVVSTRIILIRELALLMFKGPPLSWLT